MTDEPRKPEKEKPMILPVEGRPEKKEDRK